MSKAIIIPSDKDQPVRWAEHTNGDWKDMTALVFNGDREGGRYTMSTAGTNDLHLSFFYDDEGLFRLEAGEHLPDIINLRAMQLWANLEGVQINDFDVPLIGDYVVVGDADDDGNSLDAPEWVMTFPFTWHQRIQIVEERAGE